MRLNRRDLLGMLVASPLVAASGCCASRYPKPLVDAVASHETLPAILQPMARAARAHSIGPVVDVHAHFFNASDVPVRGFLAECLGHRAPEPVRGLLELLAKLADIIADLAPTAAEEVAWLRSLAGETRGLSAADAQRSVRAAMDKERAAAAERAARAIRGSEFERRYLQLKAPALRSLRPTLTPGEILAIVAEGQQPSPRGAVPLAPRSAVAAGEDAADGVLGFLFYMLSKRSANLDAYVDAFQRHEDAFGIDMVLGALVDFDYWIDCPPRSAHDDQVALHALLAQLHGGFFRPLVAYNPWTDINQGGAGLARVVKAVTTQGFVGVKIYPPMGFLPAGNATTPVTTSKRRPDLARLDTVLGAFFDKCAQLRIPVLAHGARSNGRDDAHDEFGGPSGWGKLLQRYASAASTPIVDVGHFGGGPGTSWTQDFAHLMRDHPRAAVFSDLGYWDELMCSATPERACVEARSRLKHALEVRLTETETVADRVMFGTDWLMLSRVKRWADYPARVLESVEAIASSADASKIFGRNAQKCFRLDA